MTVSDTSIYPPISTTNKISFAENQLPKKSLTVSNHYVVSLGSNQFAYLPILVPLQIAGTRNEAAKPVKSASTKKMKKQKKKCRCRKNFKKGIKQRIVDIYYEIIAAHPYLSIRAASKVIYDRLSKDEYTSN